VIALAQGANPQGIAVTADGTTALVAESGSGKVAVLNLAKFMVTTEIATGRAPRTSPGTTEAVVVNTDNDTVSILNLTNNTIQTTLTVGPRAGGGGNR